MSREMVDQLVNAVLYEGYILYPYRPSSAKNRQRFTFGRVYPYAFSQAQNSLESYTIQTQCLLRSLNAQAAPLLTVRVRFLQPLMRQVGRLIRPLTVWSEALESPYQPTPELRVGSRIYQTWQEAVEREVTLNFPLSDLTLLPHQSRFAFAASRTLEPIHAENDQQIIGILERQQAALEGRIELSCEPVDQQTYRLTVRVLNLTPFAEAQGKGTEDQAVLMRTFVSAHIILTAEAGEFISLLEPPDSVAEAAAACHNQGLFPVLVGSRASRDTLLASPIILYDFPEIAPESGGDLFDSTEIDEILTLRIMSMTDDEKSEMRQVDERARQLLQRTEALLPDDLMALHGTLREMRSHPHPQRSDDP